MRTVTFILLLFSLSLTAQSSLEKESTNIRQLINYGQFEKAYQLSDSLLQSLPNRKNATWIRLLNLNSEALLVINTDQLLVEKQLLEVIQYYESKNDTLNEDLGIAYRNLAMLYSDGIKVRLPAAIKLFNKSNQIMIALFGKESDQYVLWGTSNLANVYLNMGVYDKAEAIYLEGLAIKEKLYGKDHMYYNAAVGHLAMFYRRIGDFKKAEYYELKSLQKEQNWFDQMIGLNNLALTYDNMGEMQKADSVYALCLSIAEGKYGRESYYFMNPYSALGFIQLRLGKYDKAKDILSEVLYTLEELGDTTSKPYMNVLDDLGLLAMEQQKFEEAEAILQKSNKLTHSVFGKNSPLNKRNLRFLSDLYMRKQDFTNAMQYKSSLFQLVTLEIENAFTILSNQEKEQFIPTNIKPYIDNLHAAALRIPNPTYQTLQYDITLATKGLLLKTNNSILQYIYNSSNTLVTANYKKLLDVRRSLAKQYGLPIKDRKEIEQLESEEGLLEKELSKSSSIFRKNQMYDKINATQIRQHLKEQEAAIEFFHFSINRPNATDSVLYAASILLPNSKDIPCLILFEEEQLRNTLKFKRDATDLNLSEIYASRGIVPKRQPLSKLVYELIWHPLDSLLARHDIKKVYYSPSGLLHQFNLTALPLDSTTILGDQYNLIQLSSTRLLATPQQRSTVPNRAYIVGGIHYSEQSNLTDNNTQSKSQFDNLWNYLPGTKEEGQVINNLLKEQGYEVNYVSENTATESSFKQLGELDASPKIIHLATHGFFFSQPQEHIKYNFQEPVYKIAENPMLRSGLVMAGANLAWKGIPPTENQDDGILTAYEISNMNLSNTELVVLSACETGLGDIQGNEGVYGLQRAFKMAGVRYLIMSLWQVPDAETSLFMQTFYQHYLDKGLSINDAFDATQKEMRTQLEDPYLWAGFVLME